MSGIQLIDSIATLRETLRHRRDAGPIGFVPTMGALHRGHGRLIERARAECETVVVSVFVNPLQFDREDDLIRYPRTLERDLAYCADLEADVLFAPSSTELYPQAQACIVHVNQLADHLCGRQRPGHFDGVATVVLKLFEIVRSDRAYFGERDRQQITIIRRLVRDFNIPVAIVGVPTVRESDGLALSSRNQHLDSRERLLAASLYQVLMEADRLIAAGECEVGTVSSVARARVPSDPTVHLEYLEIVGPDDMQPVQAIAGPVVVAAAMWVGQTRLIDNVLSTPKGSEAPRLS